MKILLLLFGLAAAASAQSPAPSLPPEARQFDFWLGEWEVYDPAGTKVGDSSIQLLANGSGLLENWTGWPRTAVSGSGKSLNAYSRTRRVWQQFWVGSGGGILELSGGLVDGKMVMSDAPTPAPGAKTLNRITWTPEDGGSVRQVWEQSQDEGKTWTVVFDGRYRRRQL